MVRTVDKDNVRLDVFVSSEWGVSRSNAKTVIEKDGALVNGVKRQKSGFELKKGDIVDFEVPKPEALEVKAENIPLDIVYEDEYMAVVNKPQGMVVHQASSYKKNDTLVNALLYNLDSLSGINGVIRPGIVHRLDKDSRDCWSWQKTTRRTRALLRRLRKRPLAEYTTDFATAISKRTKARLTSPLREAKKTAKKWLSTVAADARSRTTRC